MADRAFEAPRRVVTPAAESHDHSFRWPFRSLPMAAQLIDHKERIIDISDVWLEMTGYRREDVIGRLASSLLHLDSARVAAMEVIPDLRFRGRSDSVALKVKAADGRLIQVACNARLTPFGDGFRVFAIMVPVGVEREPLEDFATVTGGWLWEMDADLRYRWVSRTVEATTGHPSNWYVGKTREEVGQADVDPEVWSAHRAALSRREPYSDFTFRADGPKGAVWLRSSGRPVFDDAGGFVGYRGAGIDVTAEIEARQAADSARDRLLSALDTSEEIYAIWDRDDRLLLCNDRYRELAGLGENKLRLGMTFEAVMRACIEAGLFPTARGREDEWLERRIELHRSPGAPFELQISKDRWLLVREQKVPSGETVLASTDITHLKRQQQELREALAAAEEANQQRAAFMAQMSHELRTPMNAILGFAEVIESQLHGPVGDKRYLEYVEHIHDSGQHLLSLINDLLDIAKIESGEFHLKEEALDVPAMVGEAMELLAPIAQRKKVKMALPRESQRAWVLADRRALRQVLMNLLSNAVKFSEPSGEVETELSFDDGGVALTVIDHGAGIPPEHLDDVWQPFAQVEDRLLSRPMLGTGLGLSVVRNLMQMHQGEASLTSEVGAGTRVTVCFPAARRLLQGS